jgi:aminoglycoside/choline kinase family phosphotransferase
LLKTYINVFRRAWLLKNQTPIKIIHWLEHICLKYSSIELLKGDASLRRYFRIHCEKQTYILMDTSKEMHYLNPFIRYARLLEQQQVLVPRIYEIDLKNGLVLLSDLSDQLFLDMLNADNCNHAYKTAMDILLNLQTCHARAEHPLPLYDEKAYRNEIELFRSWYIPYYLQKSLSSKQEHIITHTFDMIIEQALSHPNVFVHRDYHSRNLIWLNNKQLGVIDFQDACLGSIAYDIASLIKDCYVKWPSKQRQKWLIYFYKQLKDKHLLTNVDLPTFSKWVDWIGLQRHLKCLGIFVRLKIKQNQSYHISHIPTILHYIYPVIADYSAFDSFNKLFETLHKDVAS